MKKELLIIFGLIFVSVLGYFGFRYFSPFGKTVNYQFNSKLPGAEEITNFSPNKDKVLKIPTQIIKTNQVRFSLNLLSNKVESIKATLKFKKGPKEIKLGVKGNEKDSFSYKLLYNSLLQNLNWKKIDDSDYTLWQKEKKYSSINEFLNNPPSIEKTLYYYLDKNKFSTIKQNNTISGKNIVFNNYLRGNHILLIEATKSPLILKVTKQDINIYDGEDKYKISIKKENKIILEKTIEDDGITDTSRLSMGPKEEIISLKDVGVGIYEVNITYIGKGFDSIITKIETNQPKIIFKGNISFWGGKPIVLYTDIKQINISSSGEDQKSIKLDDKYDLDINQKGKVFNFNLETLSGTKEKGGLYKLDIPKGYLTVSGVGYFALTKDQFFNPELEDITSIDNLDNIEYILTSYHRAKEEGNWLVSKIEFDVKNIKIEDEKLLFSLESPELKNYGGELEIDSLEIIAKSDGVFKDKNEEEVTENSENNKSFFQKIAGFFNNILDSFKNFFQNIGSFFSNIFNSIKTFFGGLFNIKSEESESEEPTPEELEEPTQTPTATLTKTPTNTPTPNPKTTITPKQTTSPTPIVTSKSKQEILVKVLNGGAEEGAAGKFADILKKEGFTKVEATNASTQGYKNTSIEYSKINNIFAEEIIKLLTKDYKIINRNENSTSSAEISVILGIK